MWTKEQASNAPPQLMPVFYDTSGKRLRRFVFSVATLCLCATALITFAIPFATAPLWKMPTNGTNGFPRAFLAQAATSDIPIIGDDKLGILNRIVKVEKTDDDRVRLVDPFTGNILRMATDTDKEQIGDSPYALDNFGRPNNRVLMLTFDDGPDTKYTPALLDLLAKERVPATFFTIGKQIVKNPSIFERIIREGHMIGNHTMTHSSFETRKDMLNREELIATDRIMRATGQYASRLFRIPKGDPDNNPLAVLQAQQLGYIQVDMDMDTRDWEVHPGRPIAEPALDGKGHVVLLHDGGGDRTATLTMVASFIKHAKAQGYTFSTVEPLLPPGYVPQKNVTVSLGDTMTLHAVQAILVAPGKVLGGLFWFGVLSLSLMSMLYLAVAAVTCHHERRRRWEDYPQDKLPFVSVVLAAWNEEGVIEKTIESLRNSDYPEACFEVIAVDDGSTDSTLAILWHCAANWPGHLIVIPKQNGGKSAAINQGIAHAKGEIVITLDADTIFLPDTITLLARHFARQTHGKQVGAVAGHVKVGNRRNLITWWQSLEYVSGICVTRIAEGALGAISIVPGACSAWRLDALLQIGGFSEDTMAEDADATLALQRLGYRIVQESGAIAQTEAPESIKALAKQRKRWTYGNIQALWKHRDMFLRPRFGVLGMLALPYALLSLVIPLIFLPLTIVVAIISAAGGNWTSIALFAAFVAGIHATSSVVALIISKESPMHLLVVPVYRIIYEPLRAYLLYASAYRVIKGPVVKWDKLERTNSVSIPTVS